MKCVKCGAELAEDSKFCNVCGEPASPTAAPTLVVENVTEAPLPAVEPITEAPALEQAAPEPVTEEPVLQPVVEPVTEAPAIIEPVTEAPVIAPVIEPVTEAPATVEPVTEAPTSAPAEPVTEAPTTAPAVAPAPAAAPEAPKKSNVGLIIVIILLVAIAAGAGIFIGKNFLKGNDGKKDGNDPSVTTVSTKTKVSFGELEYEIPDDYEYYYDTLSQGMDCLVIDMSSDLELIIYETQYSYFAFENVFDQIVSESYPTAITTIKKANKYAFVNYKSEADGKVYFFYDGAVNTNTSHGLGVIVIKLNNNLEDKDLTKALNITDTAKKARGVERTTEGNTDHFSYAKGQTVITSYVSETEETPETPETPEVPEVPEE